MPTYSITISWDSDNYSGNYGSIYGKRRFSALWRTKITQAVLCDALLDMYALVQRKQLANPCILVTAD